MKLTKYLALFCLFSLLTAFTCENEPLDDIDDTGSTTTVETDLVGTWNLVEFDAILNTATTFEGLSFTSDIAIVSTDVDYVLVFTESAFTTNGSYSYNTDIEVDGASLGSDSYTINDVSGSGTYTTNGNEMTVDGAFYEFDVDGMDTSALGDAQTGEFELSSDGQTLTFAQSETITETDDLTGFVITTITTSSSVWTRD